MNRLLRTAATVLAATAAIALAGCANGAGSASPVGTWGDTSVKTAPSLVLSKDGTLGGTDGCNILGGSWSADGDTITFSDVFSTLMYCEGVDTWLATMASGRIAGDTMTIFDEDGGQLGTLERSATAD